MVIYFLICSKLKISHLCAHGQNRNCFQLNSVRFLPVDIPACVIVRKDIVWLCDLSLISCICFIKEQNANAQPLLSGSPIGVQFWTGLAMLVFLKHSAFFFSFVPLFYILTFSQKCHIFVESCLLAYLFY